MWSITVPASVRVGKKRRFSLNLNAYRNAHHHLLSDAKKEFEKIVSPSVLKIPRMDRAKLTFTLFMGTNHLADTANVCSIVDKFFCDTMVNCGRIEDDNYNVIVANDYRFGGKVNGETHVVVTIEPVGEIYEDIPEKENEMQITITQDEIETAIANFILSQVSVNEDMDINIDLKATRGDEGYTAVINIVPKSDSADSNVTTLVPNKEAAASTRGPGRPRGKTKEMDPEPSLKQDVEPEPENQEEEDAPSTGLGIAEAVAEAQQDNNPAPGEVTQEEAKAEEEPAPAPKKSIFANVKKPVNS
jgi:hypothetical protein